MSFGLAASAIGLVHRASRARSRAAHLAADLGDRGCELLGSAGHCRDIARGLVGGAEHARGLLAGLFGSRRHLVGVGFKIGRSTHQGARDAVEMRAELFCEVADLDHAAAETVGAGIDHDRRTAERAGQSAREDLSEILAAAGIVHRRRGLAQEGVGDVEHVVDRLLDRPDPPGLTIAEDARFEIAMRGLAADIGDLIDSHCRAMLAPDGVAEQHDRRARQRRTGESGHAEERESERNDCKNTRERGRSLRLRERAQIHRNRHPVA